MKRVLNLVINGLPSILPDDFHPRNYRDGEF